MITRTTEYQLHTAPQSAYCEFLKQCAFLLFFSTKSGRALDKWEVFEMGITTEAEARSSAKLIIVEAEGRKAYMNPKIAR